MLEGTLIATKRKIVSDDRAPNFSSHANRSAHRGAFVRLELDVYSALSFIMDDERTTPVLGITLRVGNFHYILELYRSFMKGLDMLDLT